MEKQILLPIAVLRELKDTFKVGRNDLRRALNYERNSSRARMLRCAALERGGLIYTEGVNRRNSDFFQKEGDWQEGNKISRLFKNGVEIQLDNEMQRLTISQKGEVVLTVCDLDAAAWKEILHFVQKIYNYWNN